ncbi:MAG: hypothetical protein V3V82_00035, partial [Acidimicrobiia bacterium]
NWHLHGTQQVDGLRDAIKRVGWAGALLFNERTNRLIDGHARKKISPGEEVPVLIGDWSEEDEKFILATLDPLAALAEVSKDAFGQLLHDVQTGSDALSAMLEGMAADNGIDLFEVGGNDPNAEWGGMPEFEHEDKEAVQSIHVHFSSQGDVAAFGQLIGQPLTEKTRAIWHPKVAVGRTADKRYGDDGKSGD